MRTLTGHPEMGEVHAVVFSPNGSCVASGSIDNFVTIWDTDTGAVVSNCVGVR